MQRWIIAGIAVLAIAVGAWILFFPTKSAGSVQYRYAKLTHGDLVRQVNSTGTLEAVTTVQVGSQVSGTLAALYVDFNDRVAKDQLLAVLDTTFLAAQVAEAEANVAKATATLNEARRNFNRTDSLAKAKLVSAVDLDQATTGFETAQANLTAVKAALLRAKTNLTYAFIRSPISGTVISRNVDRGQTVAASLNAPTLFVIAQDLSKMRLLAAVDEADIGQVAHGNPVTFTVEAFPELSFKGEVEQVRLSPITSSNVVTYTVVIGVDNASGKLMPGMTATVTIETARVVDAVKVSRAALRFKPASDRNSSKSGTGSSKMASGNGTPSQSGVATPASKTSGKKRKGSSGSAPSFTGALAGYATDSTKTESQVYQLDPQKNLIKRTVFIGLSTNTEAEIFSELQVGDSVIVGVVNNASASSTNSSSKNPLTQQGGPPGPGRR
ncbi:MAG: efflux RND transporter periplasmic adaptor subunit [bacterium]|nr:efflux RND transporter periplasmic adaptor subunit [bacterium]